MTEEQSQEWAKYIYGLLGCDYYENLSTGAECYLEKNGKTAENDFLEDLAELDVNICEEFWNKQPLKECAEKWLNLVKKSEQRFGEYNPIENVLMYVVWHKLYGETYDNNKYHPVRFYCEFGIKAELDTFNKIKGEDVGGWVNAWENPQRILNNYNSLVVGVIHPSKQETQQLLEENEQLEQMTIGDVLWGKTINN